MSTLIRQTFKTSRLAEFWASSMVLPAPRSAQLSVRPLGCRASRSTSSSAIKRTGALLEEMKRHSTPVVPKRLGAIGSGHLCAKLEAEGAEPETIQYKMAAVEWNGIPYLIEAAFGWCPEGECRSIVTGVNWAVAIGDPFRSLGVNGESLGAILTDLECDEEQPIVVALHVACPRIEYLDRGKSAISLPYYPRSEIVQLVTDVTKKWTKQRKA
jgi:hypothetical protein